VALAQDDDVVEAVAPVRAGEAVHEGILPGLRAAVSTSWICRPFMRWEGVPVDGIAIAEEMGGGAGRYRRFAKSQTERVRRLAHRDRGSGWTFLSGGGRLLVWLS
jgi:hypothetical protein